VAMASLAKIVDRGREAHRTAGLGNAGVNGGVVGAEIFGSTARHFLDGRYPEKVLHNLRTFRAKRHEESPLIPLLFHLSSGMLRRLPPREVDISDLDSWLAGNRHFLELPTVDEMKLVVVVDDLADSLMRRHFGTGLGNAEILQCPFQVVFWNQGTEELFPVFKFYPASSGIVAQLLPDRKQRTHE